MVFFVCTFHEGCSKSSFLNIIIRYEFDIQLVPSGVNIVRHFIATITTNFVSLTVYTVTNFDIIVFTIIVIFDLIGVNRKQCDFFSCYFFMKYINILRKYANCKTLVSSLQVPFRRPSIRRFFKKDRF